MSTTRDYKDIFQSAFETNEWKGTHGPDIGPLPLTDPETRGLLGRTMYVPRFIPSRFGNREERSNQEKIEDLIKYKQDNEALIESIDDVFRLRQIMGTSEQVTNGDDIERMRRLRSKAIESNKTLDQTISVRREIARLEGIEAAESTIIDNANKILQDTDSSIRGLQQDDLIERLEYYYHEQMGLEINRQTIKDRLKFATDHSDKLVRLLSSNGPIADGRIFNPIVEAFDDLSHELSTERLPINELAEEVAKRQRAKPSYFRDEVTDRMSDVSVVYSYLQLMADYGYLTINSDSTVELDPNLIYKSW